MYRNFDGSRALVSGPFWRPAADIHLLLAATAIWGVIVAATPSEAATPTDPNEPYIGVDAGDGPDYDKFISTRYDAEGGAYLLEAFKGSGNPHGVAHSSASVSEVRIGDAYFNPDLHASVSGEAKGIGDLSGSVDTSANASFRDIITIKKLPPGIIYGYPFVIDFAFDGTLVGTGDSRSASRGWANVAINLSMSDLDQPDIRAYAGVGLSSLPEGEAPVGYQAGFNGPASGQLEMRLNVKAGARLMIEGSIDMYGNATGGDSLGAIFNADFSNSVRFGAIHIYTDDTLTTELTDYTIESAFGFDYRANVVPEPASITQLAIVGVLFGTTRRKWAPAAACR